MDTAGFGHIAHRFPMSNWPLCLQALKEAQETAAPLLKQLMEASSASARLQEPLIQGPASIPGEGSVPQVALDSIPNSATVSSSDQIQGVPASSLGAIAPVSQSPDAGNWDGVFKAQLQQLQDDVKQLQQAAGTVTAAQISEQGAGDRGLEKRGSQQQSFRSVDDAPGLGQREASSSGIGREGDVTGSPDHEVRWQGYHGSS
jgi:flagellar hook-basal body complex protein FliE